MRALLPFLLIPVLLAGCTVFRLDLGHRPPREALILEVGVSTFEETLELLGPPDGFCREDNLEALELQDSGIRDHSAFFGLVPPTTEEPCFLWTAIQSQIAFINPGAAIGLATKIFAGVSAAPPMIFGTRLEEIRFVRVRFDREGIVRDVHFHKGMGEFQIEVDPFQGDSLPPPKRFPWKPGSSCPRALAPFQFCQK